MSALESLQKGRVSLVNGAFFAGTASAEALEREARNLCFVG